jgi:HAL2 family 3'(2'),5'-bisphosphate nucleotidase
MPIIDLTYELKVAMDAVRTAAGLCRMVQAELGSGDKLQKEDRSPVTVADFASQAVICALLSKGSSVEHVMAEESARELAKTERVALRVRVVERVRAALGDPSTEEQVLEWIDRGAWRPNNNFLHPYWTLDPVDGTKGFLRGGHYAVALALVDRGRVLLGVLACPNLQDKDDTHGVLATATDGQGATLFPLDRLTAGRPLRLPPVSDLSLARLCESVEPGHSDQKLSAQVAARLGLSRPPLRIDSQVKYAALAIGQSAIYLRIPQEPQYQEKVWDHAAGLVIVQEAGAIVTDLAGRPFDFTQGDTLRNNHGIIAAHASIHQIVLKATQETLGTI